MADPNPTEPQGVHEFRANVTKLLARSRADEDFPVHLVGAYRRIEGVFMSPRRYRQLTEAENLVEDLGLAAVAVERDDDRYEHGTTADFLAAAESREP